VFWLLLQFSRLMRVMRAASEGPVGRVDSAVMLNAKLRKGMTLMHVIAMTRALGQQHSPKDEQPEVFSWRDAGASTVTCTFAGGKLQDWQLQRPDTPE